MKSSKQESKMNRMLSNLFIFLPTHVFALSFVGFATAADKPNIIIFLADDLGYADIGVNGCKDIPTPHVDAIAKGGVRFTDGYAAHPVCSPSRAALLSGMYQHRFGFEHNSGPERFASPDFGMPRDVPSLAEKLKAEGYATGMVGKWHIGFKEGLRPHERGFDFHYGFMSGARSFYPDNPRELDPIVRNGVPVRDEQEYLTDAFARESVDFIERSKDQPWFLYLAFNAVHSPLEATEKYESRFPNITDKKRKTYAGMLCALDDTVGRVMTKVCELGEEENTLIFFYSDNGGPTAETSSRNDPLRGFKGQMFDGGIRVPFVMQWKGKIAAGQTYREPVMGFDCHATALTAAGVEIASDEPIDGVNLLPFVTGESKGRPHEKLFWRAGRNHAVRMGDWKLVDVAQQGGSMLFNLREDIGEQHNLAASQPDKLRELQAAFAEWEKGTQRAKWVRQDQRNAEAGGKLKSGFERDDPPRRSPNAGRFQAALKAADKNGDGKLSCEEYDPLVVGDVKPAHVDLTIKDMKRNRDIPIRVYLPETKQAAPVVLFSHGLGGNREGSAFLGRHWASRGYVAVFLQHPGSDDTVWKDLPITQRMAALKQAAGLREFLLRVQDVPAVLDQLANWNEDMAHAFAERLDLHRVGMSGHSFGAITTQAVSGQIPPIGQGFTDIRIKAAVIMSPSGPANGNVNQAFSSVKIPWMLLTGTKDNNPISGADPKTRLVVLPALPLGSKYQLVLNKAEHSAFTERALPGETERRNPNHHRAILAVTTAFWDAYLQNDESARKWLDGESVKSVLEKEDKWHKK